MTGTYLQVWEGSNFLSVQPEHEPSIDGAVSHWLDTQRDCLVRMTTVSGDEYVTRASLITSWAISTPEGRRRHTEMEKHSMDEERENRVAVGLPWEAE